MPPEVVNKLIGEKTPVFRKFAAYLERCFHRGSVIDDLVQEALIAGAKKVQEPQVTLAEAPALFVVSGKRSMFDYLRRVHLMPHSRGRRLAKSVAFIDFFKTIPVEDSLLFAYDDRGPDQVDASIDVPTLLSGPGITDIQRSRVHRRFIEHQTAAEIARQDRCNADAVYQSINLAFCNVRENQNFTPTKNH